MLLDDFILYISVLQVTIVLYCIVLSLQKPGLKKRIPLNQLLNMSTTISVTHIICILQNRSACYFKWLLRLRYFLLCGNGTKAAAVKWK